MAASTPHGIRGTGWRRDLPDLRSVQHRPAFGAAQLPSEVDLRKTGFASPIEDQYAWNACTSFAVGGCYEYLENKQHTAGEHYQISKAYLYWNTRYLEGTTTSDAGASLHNTITAIQKWGAPAWHNYPYVDPHKFTEPPATVYNHGEHHVALQALAVAPTLDAIKSCLFEGYPLAFGTAVYGSFMQTGPDGIVRLPNPATDGPPDGHAMYVLGYDDARQVLIVPNSWGPWFGDHGFIYIPYAYVAQVGFFDLWTLREISDATMNTPVTPIPA